MVEKKTRESELNELIYCYSIWKANDTVKTGIWWCFIITLGSGECLMRVADVGLSYKFVDLSTTCQWLSVKER